MYRGIFVGRHAASLNLRVNPAAERCRSIGSFVIAGEAAWFAVHQTILADADFVGGLAQAAEFVALATAFRHFALDATEFCVAHSGRHVSTLAPSGVAGNVPLVTAAEWLIENPARPDSESAINTQP